jgi:hypothetical protein
VARLAGLGGRGPVIAGSPEEVADELEGWFEETGVDGFSLMSAVYPEGFTDFIELVVPVLQERGLFKKSYREGTYRQQLFGRGALTPSGHPASAIRGGLR